MTVFNEVEYEMYKEQKVKNLINDEKTYIIDHKPSFNSWPEAYAILKEEIEETTEEVEKLNEDLKLFWKLIRENAPDAAMIQRLNVLVVSAENTIYEVMQVGAVAKKAIEQLEKGKVPVTDQSKQALKK